MHYIICICIFSFFLFIVIFDRFSIFMTCCQVLIIQSTTNNREKRYILFTPGTQWGVFATVLVPLHPETFVSMAWFIEANYYNVANASYFEPLLGDISIPINRKERGVRTSEEIMSRTSVYIFIEAMLEKYGMAGRPCLLRAICDHAEKHLLHNGILGDLIYVILTPSTSISEDELADSYYEAEYYGLQEECNHYNEECPDSPLDLISLAIDQYM